MEMQNRAGQADRGPKKGPIKWAFCYKSLFLQNKSERPYMFKIDLDELRKGLPGFTPTAGGFLAEAAIYCLEFCGHKTGAELTKL